METILRPHRIIFRFVIRITGIAIRIIGTIVWLVVARLVYFWGLVVGTVSIDVMC